MPQLLRAQLQQQEGVNKQIQAKKEKKGKKTSGNKNIINLASIARWKHDPLGQRPSIPGQVHHGNFVPRILRASVREPPTPKEPWKAGPRG